MSERDLPSRVDAERTIPASKSVPALHHISPGSEQPRGGVHDVFNPGYSRTSSNNSINTNCATAGPQNGTTVNNQTAAALRSRSTHNLHQQDAGFYQNLSVYRNKMPSPQQLGDRSSALRSSQNSLQSSITGPQRPSSAYYPPSAVPAAARSNLHQSIPNLKSPPSTQRIIQNEDAARSGSYPSVNQQQYPPQNYPGNATYGDRQTYNLPQHPPYAQAHYPQEGATRQYSGGPYLGQKINEGGPYHGYNGQQHYSAQDVYRHAQQRPEEMMRYPSANNVRIAEAQIQSKTQQDELNRQNEMRMSKSEDMLRQYAANNHNEILRYASSGNVRSQESSRVDLQPLKHAENRGVEERNHALKEESRNVRGQAKMAEMSEEVRRRQNRTYYQQQSAFPVQGNQNYYQQQHYNQHQQNYHPNPHLQMVQNTQSLQNLSLNQQAYPGNPVSYPYYQQNQPISSPNYPKTPPVAPKPLRKTEEPPELPPTSTHPLYSASSQDPPKMALYPNNNNSANVQNKTPRDPWAREEQERQAEIRREQARQWQEQQIRELLTLPNRTQQQEEQLRVLQLEREFQRRALEAAEQDDEDTEKESPTPASAPGVKQEPPPSILKPGVPQNNHVPPPEPVAPPPPERGSSYAVMSLRNKETTKRVSFNDAGAPSVPNALQLDETIREDPNSFIRQAESMLASPTTPTDSSPGMANVVTPGVIGAQEVYRDPRAKRLAEQAQQKAQMPVPEKLSFKEKMKMFAMETGEAGTPKDKSKISRAQREIDNLGAANSNLVH